MVKVALNYIYEYDLRYILGSTIIKCWEKSEKLLIFLKNLIISDVLN